MVPSSRTSCSKGEGHVMTYPFEYPVTPEPRTQRSMEEQAIGLHSGLQAEEGVKSISPLLLLPEFDIVQGFPVDYMHAACEGVVEQLLDLWTDKVNHNRAWYIGNSMAEIDERMAAVVPPSDITRLPRSPSQKAHWKASEFRSWILFYCLPILKGILPAAFLSHTLLLVHALWILLQDTVTLDEISMCEIVLTKFVIGMEELYGIEHMTYNVHLMLHLSKTVQLWGPLWSNSCFPFEGYNRKIKSLFHGTRYVQAQIAQNFTVMRLLRIKVERLPVDTSPVILQCIQDLLRGYPVTVRASSLHLGDMQVLLMGNPQNYEAPMRVEEMLHDHFGLAAEGLIIHKFSCVVVNGRKFSTPKLTGRREDCYVSYDGTCIGVVSAILRVRTDTTHKVVLLISKRKVQRVNFGNDQQTGANAGHICEILEYREEMFVLRCVKEKYLKCVTVKLRGKTYCMKLPNGIELD
ncbi:hypothetical protein HOLleu_37316 [Holothuria leucospilota]|uniref:DUF4218 domain-containing protein n=1 Tax=Holothuria leucospilota TaxID=206669 RepID=A0A9Q0YGY9_HOLLE|nr:hypothetical protein HOLleu_37316 [Holothuria leucospilota]